ncbi:hypothetical protein [Metabacillus fastidiosus]|uniref:hypothetical protein n=1 Tax=Metabacillus fastidiosus TaxID=1458 RepID=UPI003D26C2CA
MEFQFNEIKFLEKADKLGIKVKVNSNNPGVFSVQDGKRREVILEELFPEVFLEPVDEDVFSLPELTVNTHTEHSSVKIKSKMVYQANPQVIGAA